MITKVVGQKRFAVGDDGDSVFAAFFAKRGALGASAKSFGSFSGPLLAPKRRCAWGGHGAFRRGKAQVRRDLPQPGCSLRLWQRAFWSPQRFSSSLTGRLFERGSIGPIHPAILDNTGSRESEPDLS